MSKTNAELMARRTAAVPRGVGQIHPIFVDSAKNSTVIDVEGRELIDFAGGIAVAVMRPHAGTQHNENPDIAKEIAR